MMRPEDLAERGVRSRHQFGLRLEVPARPDPLLMARVALVAAVLVGFKGEYERCHWMRTYLPGTARELGLFEPAEIPA